MLTDNLQNRLFELKIKISLWKQVFQQNHFSLLIKGLGEKNAKKISWHRHFERCVSQEFPDE